MHARSLHAPGCCVPPYGTDALPFAVWRMFSSFLSGSCPRGIYRLCLRCCLFLPLIFLQHPINQLSFFIVEIPLSPRAFARSFNTTKERLSYFPSFHLLLLKNINLFRMVNHFINFTYLHGISVRNDYESFQILSNAAIIHYFR